MDTLTPETVDFLIHVIRWVDGDEPVLARRALRELCRLWDTP
jgi:hypothetical protein